MLRFDRHFDFLKMDLPRYHKTLDRIVGQIFRESIRDWLRVILEVGVPVETGMAKAALEPVGRFLNRVGGLQINPTRKPYYSKLEGGVQSPDLGREKSSFNVRDDKSHPLTFIYTFEWSTSVLHWYFAQFYNGARPAGEEILPEAAQKFDQVFAGRLQQRLPHFWNFIKLSQK